MKNNKFIYFFLFLFLTSNSFIHAKLPNLSPTKTVALFTLAGYLVGGACGYYLPISDIEENKRINAFLFGTVLGNIAGITSNAYIAEQLNKKINTLLEEKNKVEE